MDCACKSVDSHTCYELRFPPPFSDFYEEMQSGDAYCECACHDIPNDYDEY